MMEMNAFHTGDKHFSAGDKCVENTFGLQPHTHIHTHTACYQQLLNRTYIEMIATHRYSKYQKMINELLLIHH